MNTIKYKALLTTLECGSFSQAAETLGYSQPSISHMLSSLEDEFGFKLLVRTKDGIYPTKNAESVLHMIRHVVEYEDNLLETVNKIRGIETGTLRIGCFSSISIMWLPQVIERFAKLHPNIDISIYVGIHHELEKWLTDGSIDVALMSAPAPNNYEFIHIAHDPIKALLPPGHPLCNKEAIRPAELIKYPFIMPVRGGDEEVNMVFKDLSEKPDVRFRTNNDNALFAMVAHGLGVSIMSELPILCSKDTGMVTRDLIPNEELDMGVALSSYRYASPSAREFIKLLKEATA